MRFKTTDISQWHSHFTWVPTKIKGEWVWMERVLRRGWPQKSASTRKRWIDWEYLNNEFELMKLQEEKNQAGQVMMEGRQGNAISTGAGMASSKAYVDKMTLLNEKQNDLLAMIRTRKG